MKILTLLECSIKHGAVSVAEQHSQLSNLHATASVLLVKHQSRKVSFEVLFAVFCPLVCGQSSVKICRLSLMKQLEVT